MPRAPKVSVEAVESEPIPPDEAVVEPEVTVEKPLPKKRAPRKKKEPEPQPDGEVWEEGSAWAASKNAADKVTDWKEPEEISEGITEMFPVPTFGEVEDILAEHRATEAANAAVDAAIEAAMVDNPLVPIEAVTEATEPPPVVVDDVEWMPTDEEIEAAMAETESAAVPGQLMELADGLVEAVAEYVEQNSHPVLGIEYNTAEFVEYAEDGTERWHELRALGIGGSDTASVLGIGFKSAYTLWMEKKGFWDPLPPDAGLENIFYWGHKQEQAIAEAFVEGHPEWEAHQGGSWRKKDAPWMLANPDRLLINTETGEVAILEIKTSETGTGWDNDKVPSKYVVQLRHYLWVFGLPFGYLVVKIGNSDYREFLVPADINEPITKIKGGSTRPSSFKVVYGDGPTIELACKNFIDSAEPPAMDGNKDIYEQIRRKNMSLDRGVEVELPVDVGTALAQTQDALDKAEKANQEARNHVMAHMGTAQYATYNGDRVASRVAKGSAAPYLTIK